MRVIGGMAFQPVKILDLGLGPCDDQIGCFRQARDGQIGFNPAFFIQPLGIDKLTRRNINVICANAVENSHGITAFKPEFGE